MTINIEKIEAQGIYRADLTELPGSPPVGRGTTPEHAVAELFFLLLQEPTGYAKTFGRLPWLRYTSLESLSIIHNYDKKNLGRI